VSSALSGTGAQPAADAEAAAVAEDVEGTEQAEIAAADVVAPDAPRSRPHIVAFDLIRLIIMVFVVGVHTLSFAGGTVTMSLGAVTTIFHTSRELFLLLTALVLSYNYGHRPLKLGKFWWRRYYLVVPAYVTWSAIYYAADGRTRGAWPSAFLHDLANAGARYHLYFLLVSMQIYLLFPLLRWVLKKTERYHWWVFAVALVYQVLLTIGLHYKVGRHSFLAPFLNGAGLGYWADTYVLYVVAGAIAGWHFDSLCAFTRRQLGTGRRIALVAAAGVAAGIGVYLIEIEVFGATPANASAVFQPVVIFEALAFGWALLGAGLLWSDRGAPGRKFAAAGSASSFGIYLAHPLVLQVLLLVAGASFLGANGGLIGDLHRMSHSSIEVLVLLFVVVPIIYAIAWVIASAARRTPFSLPLTGREYTGPLQFRRILAGPLRRLRALPVIRRFGRFRRPRTVRGVIVVSSVIVVFLAGSVSAGVAAYSALQGPSEQTVHTMQVGTMTRSYTVIKSTTATLPQSAPIIVFLAGLFAPQQQEIGRDQFLSYVNAGEAEMVYPLPYRESWNAIGCCSWAAQANINDLGFIESLVPKIDPGHEHPIYVVGFSNGGRLAYRLACTDPTLFDGTAVIKADPIPGCVVQDPMKILQVASVDDDRVPYQPGDGGVESPPATVQVADLRATDECSAAATVEHLDQVTYTVWSSCADGSRVGFGVYSTGKHLYPRPPTSSPAASQVVWAFFTNAKLAPQPTS
jgi:poly(3-hydroxybutyrate) depolymerase/peptidoglycan/LPS O-acetylase OafA/YrhL